MWNIKFHLLIIRPWICEYFSFSCRCSKMCRWKKNVLAHTTHTFCFPSRGIPFEYSAAGACWTHVVHVLIEELFIPTHTKEGNWGTGTLQGLNSLETMVESLLPQKNLRRREEDVDYWRQRAGWFDDDVSMTEFNQGVYDSYYGIDDDGYASGGSNGSGNGGSGTSANQATFLKVAAVLVALGIAILLYRAVQRRTANNESLKKRRDKSRSRSKSRSGGSRSSRSRSRSKKSSDKKSSDYALMDDGERSRKSNRSSRSRSRSKRSKGKGRSRSRSKSRPKPPPTSEIVWKQAERTECELVFIIIIACWIRPLE